MLTADAILTLQADHHALVKSRGFTSVEEYCLFLMHTKAYAEAAAMVAGATVIDLGCNSGYGTRLLAASARRVHGLDVSARAIDFAAQQDNPANVDFALTDGTALPFADDSIDVVVSFQVLEHIGIYRLFFAEIKRVLRPGGRLILTTPNAAIRLDQDRRPWNVHHVREFTAGQLEALLAIWFPRVVVRGLRAADHFRAVELGRVTRARRNARNRLRSRFVRRLKLALPDTWVAQLSRRLAKPGHGHATDFERYSIDDLSYRDDPAEAIDLMAICYL